MPNLRIEASRRDGFLAVYATFRTGKVHTTYELQPGLAADVDREGRVLGVEILKTFARNPKRIRFERMIKLDDIQRAVEAKFKVRLTKQFEEIRQVGAAFSA